MKNKKISQVISGLLIPSVLLQSCDSQYFIDTDDVVSINENQLKTRSSIAIPINLNLNSKDLQFLEFIQRIVVDIVKHPSIARSFAKNPKAVAKLYGVNELEIDFEDPVWKLIGALGEEDLHEAIMTNNVKTFFALCKEKGLMSEIQKSDILKYQNITIPCADTPQLTSDADLGLCGVEVVFIAVAAGIVDIVGDHSALYDQAAVYEQNFYWSSSETQSALAQRSFQVLQLWTLKKGNESSAMLLSKYQEQTVDECIEAIRVYFPEKLEGINMEYLRQFIALNLPK